jgi:tryptophanyl-tRNA synthetase
MPGLDGQKMSKSYNNTIALRDSPEEVSRKLRTMPTDPARVRRNDPGDPAKCPVWQFHEVYSDDDTREWVRQGCTSAGIGCVVEKPAEGGREVLSDVDAPILTLATIEFVGDHMKVY